MLVKGMEKERGGQVRTDWGGDEKSKAHPKNGREKKIGNSATLLVPQSPVRREIERKRKCSAGPKESPR